MFVNVELERLSYLLQNQHGYAPATTRTCVRFRRMQRRQNKAQDCTKVEIDKDIGVSVS